MSTMMTTGRGFKPLFPREWEGLASVYRGGGTGPADPVAAGPMLEGLPAKNKLNG